MGVSTVLDWLFIPILIGLKIYSIVVIYTAFGSKVLFGCFYSIGLSIYTDFDWSILFGRFYSIWLFIPILIVLKFCLGVSTDLVIYTAFD